jgi:hypothetical protein
MAKPALSPLPPSLAKKRLTEISDLFQLQKKFEKFKNSGKVSTPKAPQKKG